MAKPVGNMPSPSPMNQITATRQWTAQRQTDPKPRISAMPIVAFSRAEARFHQGQWATNGLDTRKMARFSQPGAPMTD